MTTSIAVIGDLHTGSLESPITDQCYIESNDHNRRVRIMPNPIQDWLYRQWCKFADSEKFDILILGGDLIEGVNRKEYGIGNWTTDLHVQKEVCADLLSMVKCRQIYGVQGSPYHSNVNGSADREVTEMLHGTFDPDLYLTVEKVHLYARHVTGYSDTPYGRSTALNRDMANAEIQKESLGPINIHLRFHTHYTHDVGWEGKRGIINPCWKARDMFVRRKSCNGNDVGYTVIYVDDDTWTWHTFSSKIPNKVAITERVYEG